MKISTFLRNDVVFMSGIILTFFADFGVGFYACSEVYAGKGHEPFILGFTSIPVYQGAGASNLDVAILTVLLSVALVVGFIMRYRHYRDELHLMKKAGIKREKSGFFQDLLEDDD